MSNQTYLTMKKTGIFILLISSLSIVNGQNNVSKIRYSPTPIVGDDVTKGIMELFNGTISFSQERKLNERMSLQATIRYLPTKMNGILDSITTVEYLILLTLFWPLTIDNDDIKRMNIPVFFIVK